MSSLKSEVRLAIYNSYKAGSFGHWWYEGWNLTPAQALKALRDADATKAVPYCEACELAFFERINGVTVAVKHTCPKAEGTK